MTAVLPRRGLTPAEMCSAPKRQRPQLLGAVDDFGLPVDFLLNGFDQREILRIAGLLLSEQTQTLFERMAVGCPPGRFRHREVPEHLVAGGSNGRQSRCHIGHGRVRFREELPTLGRSVGPHGVKKEIAQLVEDEVDRDVGDRLERGALVVPEGVRHEEGAQHACADERFPGRVPLRPILRVNIQHVALFQSLFQRRADQRSSPVSAFRLVAFKAIEMTEIAAGVTPVIRDA